MIAVRPPAIRTNVPLVVRQRPPEAEHKPRVSIGLPVRNGGATIREAITSLLAQTFSDFELIVSDNASTDATQAACRSFEDPRIRYVRQSANMGAPANFRFVLSQAQGDFFMWAAADDWYHPEFLSRNLASLERHPQAVASGGCVRMGDEPEQRRVGTSALTGSFTKRLLTFLASPGDNSRCYSLCRRHALYEVTSLPSFVGFDWAFVVCALKHGEFVRVDGELVIRSVGGASRSPDYDGRWLFLWPFTCWLLKSVPLRFLLPSIPTLVLWNLRFSRPWFTLRRPLKRISAQAQPLPRTSC